MAAEQYRLYQRRRHEWHQFRPEFRPVSHRRPQRRSDQDLGAMLTIMYRARAPAVGLPPQSGSLRQAYRKDTIHSAEVLAPGHTHHAHSGTRGDQSPYHETYKGHAPSPIRRSPRHGQRFPWTCRYEVNRGLRSGGPRDETQGSRLGKRPPTDPSTNAPSVIEPHRVARSSVAHYVTDAAEISAKKLETAPLLTMTRDLP